MKLVILYHPNSDHASRVEAYAHDFRMRYDIGDRMELISVDTRDGANMATLYDIVLYPSLLALNDEGSLIFSWRGDTLPLMDEVASYIHK